MHLVLPTLTKVIADEGLTTIGNNAFIGATKLTSIELKNALTTIGKFAFKGTALASIALGGSIAEIGENAFEGATSLTNLDLRKATNINTIKANAFKDSGLSTMVIGKNTGSLATIEANAFNSTATEKQVSFLDDEGNPLNGNDLTTLAVKYKALKDTDKGAWKLNTKFSTPTAKADYDTMKITSLEPSTAYTINGEEYMSDADGKLDILKGWSKTELSIVKKATENQEASEPQKLSIDGIHTLTIDGVDKGLKKEGSSITVTAPEKAGNVFTKWITTDMTLPTTAGREMTFTMPESDVNLTTEYTAIIVETPVKSLLFTGKNDVVVTITSAFANFDKLSVDGTDLTKNTDYSVNGTENTIITLKKKYLDTLTKTTTFAATFTEGGDITFAVGLYGAAPTALADYKEMKLTGLIPNAKYKIENEVLESDAKGTINIKKAWGSKTIEIIKAGTDTVTDSKPQNLPIEALYSINVNTKEFKITTAGTKVTITAESKQAYKFKEWKATGVTLENAQNAEITFAMPENDVALEAVYEKIILTKPEEMVFDGTNPVTIRFSYPMSEFQNVEYNGQVLVKNRDYTVESGSTIIRFTKSFLDKIKGDMNGVKAIFASGPVEFSIKFKAPLLPEVAPTPLPVTPPPARPAVNKTNVKTGDTTNIVLLLTVMMLSAGAFLVVKKRKKQ